MANRKSWWDQLPEPIRELRGHALFKFLEWAVGAALGSFGGTHVIAVPSALNVFLVLIGVYLMGMAVFGHKRRTPEGTETLPQRLLFEEADLLHRAYRNLNQEHQEEARFPLQNRSWPAFGGEWSIVQVNLYSLSMQTKWLLLTATKAFSEMHWPTESVELFRITEQSRMVDLLHALEEFRLLLRSKFPA
ncbi:MAG TPA: hypothetical protein VK335_08410 [Bryobacteraceae bacterium]|nr:hypothetical protein [Bryobacteraceae bacterium]